MNDTNYQGGLIDNLNKGLGALPDPISPAQTQGLGWRLLDEEISLPAAVLYDGVMQQNLQWMQSFVTQYGVKLAPHGKTTMAPKLFARQLDGGAWGITLATAQQTRVAYAHGVRRVIMANQLVGKRNMEIIGQLIADADFEFFCLVDNADGVEQLGRFFWRARPDLECVAGTGRGRGPHWRA